MMDRREALLLVERLARTRDPDVLTLCEYVHGTDVHGTDVHGTDVHGTIPAFRRPGDGTPPAVFPSALCPVCAARRAAETAREKKMAPWEPRLTLMSAHGNPAPGKAPEVRCSRCCGTVRCPRRPRLRNSGVPKFPLSCTLLV